MVIPTYVAQKELLYRDIHTKEGQIRTKKTDIATKKTNPSPQKKYLPIKTIFL